MNAFPGRIFDGDGVSVDGLADDLTQNVIDACPHRSMVTAQDCAPVGRIWLLNDTATFNAIPHSISEVAVTAIAHGQALLLLAKLSEPMVDVRDEVLWSLEAYSDLVAKSPCDVAGHA